MRAKFFLCGAFLLATASVVAAEIHVVGTDLLGPAFARAVAKFVRENDSPVRLDLHGSRPGLEALRGGDADLGLFIFPPGELPPGDTYRYRVVAYQTAMVLVPVKLPLTEITTGQLRDIFGAAGKNSTERWGDIGLTGPERGRTITPRALADRSGLTLPLFRRVVLQDTNLRQSVELADNIPALLARLLASDNSIGLVPYLPVVPAGLRLLAIAPSATEPAYPPSPATLHDGTYQLCLPVYVVFPRAAAPRLLLFLKFLLSEECADALVEANFAPLPVTVRNQLTFEFEELP